MIKIVIYGQFASSSALITFLCYLISIGSNATATHPILLAALGQLYIYCYFGDQLKENALEVANYVYFTCWYKLSTNQRKMLLIMMMRSQKEVIISADGLLDMSLNSFYVVRFLI